MLNITPIASSPPLRSEPLTLDAREAKTRLRLAADGMTAGAILDAIASLAPSAEPKVEIAVDVTNAWSIPWTTQPIEAGTRFVRHKGFRWASDRTEAVYEVTAA